METNRVHTEWILLYTVLYTVTSETPCGHMTIYVELSSCIIYESAHRKDANHYKRAVLSILSRIHY